MISVGFCYGGEIGYAGYRPEGVFQTVKEAQAYITEKVGCQCSFIASGKKFRAYEGDQAKRTGYIYFQVVTEVYALIDSESINECTSDPVVKKVGTLDQCKKVAEKAWRAEEFQTDTLTKLKWKKVRDGYEMYVKDGTYEDPTIYRVVRIKF